jgi:hypothetical protein
MTATLAGPREVQLFDTFASHFTWEDEPMGFEAGDANLYRYVGNSPTNHVDPAGTIEVDPGWGGQNDIHFQFPNPFGSPSDQDIACEIAQLLPKEDYTVDPGMGLGEGINLNPGPPADEHKIKWGIGIGQDGMKMKMDTNPNQPKVGDENPCMKENEDKPPKKPPWFDVIKGIYQGL